MKKLLHSRYLKEKGFLGPFSLTEAFLTLCIGFLTYIISCLCEDWLHYNRMWTLTWTSIVFMFCFLGKLFIRNKNPTWLSSIFSYYFFQPHRDDFRITSIRYAFLKKK